MAERFKAGALSRKRGILSRGVQNAFIQAGAYACAGVINSDLLLELQSLDQGSDRLLVVTHLNVSDPVVVKLLGQKLHETLYLSLNWQSRSSKCDRS
jgi:hypothetical protein